MAPALGQSPSMRNREGQHLVHEYLCIGSHHPEGLDDQLTLTSVGNLGIPPEGDRYCAMKTSMSATTARVRSVHGHAQSTRGASHTGR